jgi:RHS repeat-associated protein
MRLKAFCIAMSLLAATAAAANEPHAGVNAPGTESWTSGAYAYDGAGNISKIGSNTYRYDGVRRVKEYLPEAGGSQSFTYDSFGNVKRIDYTPAGGATISRVIPIDSGSNQVGSSAGALYDRAGNMLSYSGTTYKYDSQNMMVLLEGPGKKYAYVYTAGDERIGMVNLAGRQWVWTLRGEDGRVLREYTSSGGTNGAGAWQWSRDAVYREKTLLAAETSAGPRHYHVDHLGTPRLITDANAVKTAFHTYMPFGEEETSMLQDRERARFTGHERDFIGGTVTENKDYLDYMHARYYNPNLARFLSADPYIDLQIALMYPQGWNRFAYVRNNPLVWTDPTGRVIAYEKSFRDAVKTDPQFRAAFQAWKRTRSGNAQWRTMGADTNTVYRFSVAGVSAMTAPLREEQANGRTLPLVSYRNEKKNGKLNESAVDMTINADFIKETHKYVPEATSRTMAKALFEEAQHGLDIGTGTMSAKDAWDAEKRFHTDTEPRMKQYEKELEPILPAPKP